MALQERAVRDEVVSDGDNKKVFTAARSPWAGPRALRCADAMSPALAMPRDRRTRLAFIEVRTDPDGTVEASVEGAGSGSADSRALGAFRDRMLVLSGLDQNSRGVQTEGAETSRACTHGSRAAARMTSGADLKAGPSVDQIAAREFGKYTQLASLEVGLESAEIVGACESAYSCAYYNTISWRNDTTPMPMENRPRAIFERLFGDTGTTDPKLRLARREENRSILDAVAEDVTRLRGRLGRTDRGKIDQYLEAVRDVERRIQLAKPKAAEAAAAERPIGIPSAFTAPIDCDGSDGVGLADRHDAVCTSDRP